MEQWLILLLAMAPGLLWLYYFYSKDKYDPEPVAWVLWIFLLGAAVTVPVAMLEGLLGTVAGGVLAAVLVAPVCEETAKYLVVKKTVYLSPVFDEPVDGIVYAAAAGLGFATVENILYLFSAFDESLMLAIQTGLVRGLLSVPGHVLFSVTWGTALGMAKFMPGREGGVLVRQGLVLAIAAHALFNYLLFSAIGFAVLVLVLVPLLWVLAERHIRNSLAHSFFRE
ncbi:MAG TPA: PrsW family glutamic-type intramembrane protease [Methanolinea sp.]|nr:PrsW family glutamic-type intramembrane protease [Methanolinea sp.]HQK55185.1 PrsW family glutamic-type intramembrane protease [Methanolinea sp.]